MPVACPMKRATAVNKDLPRSSGTSARIALLAAQGNFESTGITGNWAEMWVRAPVPW